MKVIFTSPFRDSLTTSERKRFLVNICPFIAHIKTNSVSRGYIFELLIRIRYEYDVKVLKYEAVDNF